MNRLLIFLIALLFSQSCYKVPSTNYYLLTTKLKPDYLESEDKEENPSAYTLRVKPAIASNIYNRNNLVYRKTMFRIGFYNYHKWAVKPEKMMTDMVYDFMIRTKIFKSVSRSYSLNKTNYAPVRVFLALPAIRPGPSVPPPNDTIAPPALDSPNRSRKW